MCSDFFSMLNVEEDPVVLPRVTLLQDGPNVLDDMIMDPELEESIS